MSPPSLSLARAHSRLESKLLGVRDSTEWVCVQRSSDIPELNFLPVVGRNVDVCKDLHGGSCFASERKLKSPISSVPSRTKIQSKWWQL